MATSKPRYTVSVDDEMFQEIEDFRFQNRYATRSEATVELIRLGLSALRNELREEREIYRVTKAMGEQYTGSKEDTQR